MSEEAACSWEKKSNECGKTERSRKVGRGENMDQSSFRLVTDRIGHEMEVVNVVMDLELFGSLMFLGNYKVFLNTLGAVVVTHDIVGV